MKRYSIILMLIPMLVCCGKDNQVERRAVPMTFVTKEARIQTKTEYVNKPVDQTVLHSVGNEVSLFGVRIENEDDPSNKTITTLFNNDILHCESVTAPTPPSTSYSSVWEYTPLKYWENSGHYYFTGVFPYHSSYLTMDSDYFINVRYYPGDNYDLMVARGYRYVEDDGKIPVPMVFNHATSAVRFLFGTASDCGDDYKITSFRVEDVSQSGTLKVASQSTSNPEIVSGNWTPYSRGHLFSTVVDNVADGVTVPYPTDTDDPDDYAQFGWYYMVPQTLISTSAVRFSVSYQGGEPVETVLSFYGATDTISGEYGYSWTPNCVYNYFITITQSGLNLTVKAIPWDDVEVTTDDILFEG